MITFKTQRGYGVLAVALAVWCGSLAVARGETDVQGIYGIPVETIDGRTTTLAEYRGKVMLIVNVASRCGFTGQYAGLQKLSEQYGPEGLVVLGFPSNDFMGQEPGTNEEIKQFCTLKYNVTFPMFAKIKVKGDGQHPLYQYLTEEKTNPAHAAEVSWNFNKFLVGRDGAILGHFGSRAAPDGDELQAAIKAGLAVGK
ncbi:MAG: glutathione peroxidase [Lentisphaerae bacterium]|nr:glutathione peroxidase [Lentisphaerota bacterium]